MAVRYFLIGIAFLLLLASFVLARGVRAGGGARALSLAAIAVFLLGNGWHTAAFLREGRGGFSNALRYMAAHSDGREIVVGSDHDFRNGLVLRFYARLLPADKSLAYVRRAQWPDRIPDWLVTHRAARLREPRPEITMSEGVRYAFAKEFDHAAISGFYWAVYRRVP